MGELFDLPGPQSFHLSVGLASQGCCVGRKECILGEGEVSVGGLISGQGLAPQLQGSTYYGHIPARRGSLSHLG